MWCRQLEFALLSNLESLSYKEYQFSKEWLVFLMMPYNIKVPIAANQKDVCLQNTSKSHSYHLKILRLL